MSEIILVDRAEDLSSEELKKYFKRATYENEIVPKLKDTGTYLLDGCRGSGKTMLMRVAEKELDENFETDRVLCVYERFPRAIALEGSSISNESNYHPFRQWVFAKLLKATIDKLTELNVLQETITLNSSQEPVELSSANLNKYIDKLEHVYCDQSVADVIENAELVGVQPSFLTEIDQPDNMKEQFINISQVFHLSRIVFLLDEVAQNLSEEYQQMFFTIVKHLRVQPIACKVAVYPHLTSYGPDFDIGHDAIVLSLDRPVEDNEYNDFFEEIAMERVAGTELAESFHNQPIFLQLLIKACFGNPRALIHLLARLPNSRKLQIHEVTGAIKDYVEQEHFKYLDGLKNRLNKHTKAILVAQELLQLFIEDTRKLNQKNSQKTLFVAVSTQKAVPYRVHKALDILVYTGLIAKRGSCKITSRESAVRYLVNFGVLIRENTLADVGQTNIPLSEHIARMTNPDRDRKKEYTKNSPELLEINKRSIEEDGATCTTCMHPVAAEDKFCSNCGKKLETEPLYQQLLSHSIDGLDITPGIMRLLVESGRFKTIGDIFNASDGEIDILPWVGPYRVKLIRYAAEEYISG